MSESKTRLRLESDFGGRRAVTVRVRFWDAGRVECDIECVWVTRGFRDEAVGCINPCTKCTRKTVVFILICTHVFMKSLLSSYPHD